MGSCYDHNCHYSQGHLRCSKEENKSSPKEGEGAQMPFYSLSLGEDEEEEEGLNPQLSSEDLDSPPYSTDKYLQENKVKPLELGKGWLWWGRGEGGLLDQISSPDGKGRS